jgi:hypothetical protein
MEEVQENGHFQRGSHSPRPLACTRSRRARLSRPASEAQVVCAGGPDANLPALLRPSIRFAARPLLYRMLDPCKPPVLTCCCNTIGVALRSPSALMNSHRKSPHEVWHASSQKARLAKPHRRGRAGASFAATIVVKIKSETFSSPVDCNLKMPKPAHEDNLEALALESDASLR